jgi:hypothetical protein
MATELTWPAARCAHLGGGIQAINVIGPSVEFEPNSIDGQRIGFQLEKYGALSGHLEASGFQLIGVDFYTAREEVEGQMPPDWRAYHRFNGSPWLTWDIQNTWSHIGHAAYKNRIGRLWDVASRISNQVRVCAWRLRQISVSYVDQLAGYVAHGAFKDGQRFDDPWTSFMYISIQAFLVDACTLRDYLAEYASLFPLNKYMSGISSINSMGGLKKKILDRVESSDGIVHLLRDATGESGWLKELGDYRDLVVHLAPLATAEKRLYAEIRQFELPKNLHLPYIICPIPDNPAEINSARSKGTYFEDFEKLIDTFTKGGVMRPPQRDGLDYCHRVLGRLAELALTLSRTSPVEPQMPVFDKANIIGPIKISYQNGE